MTSLPPPETSPSKEGRSIRVLVVDDHPVFRLGISRIIDGQEDMKVCGEAGNAPMALDAMRRLLPDVAITDISMPGTNGIELLKMLKAEQPSLGMLTLSAHDESIYAIRALRAGALGYVMKSEAIDSIAAAVRKVAAGKPFLSPAFSERLVLQAIHSFAGGLGSQVDALSDRELEILTLTGRGFGAQDTADELRIGLKTVETHRANIKKKMGFPSAREMVRFAVEWAASPSQNRRMTAENRRLARYSSATNSIRPSAGGDLEINFEPAGVIPIRGKRPFVLGFDNDEHAFADALDRFREGPVERPAHKLDAIHFGNQGAAVIGSCPCGKDVR